MDKTDILYSALMGSKVAESIPKFRAIQNEFSKRVVPVPSFLPLENEKSIFSNDKQVEGAIWKSDGTSDPTQFFPLLLEDENGNNYQLPYEPIINISGKNTIIRRNVAKGAKLQGSIKERWNQDDYEITITGILVGALLVGNTEQCFPREDFEKLKNIFTQPRAIRVYCEPLNLLDINYIVIEDFSFPFTKGENVQAYEIKAYSDFTHNLLIDLNEKEK